MTGIGRLRILQLSGAGIVSAGVSEGTFRAVEPVTTARTMSPGAN